MSSRLSLFSCIFPSDLDETWGGFLGLARGGGGGLISKSLRYGLCEPQCPDYFSVLKLETWGGRKKYYQGATITLILQHASMNHQQKYVPPLSLRRSAFLLLKWCNVMVYD